MNVTVVGLGKLGAPLAAVLANGGNNVWCTDKDPTKVDALNAGSAPVTEPGLKDLLDQNRDRLHPTDSIEDAVAATEMSLIVVPTPSDTEGRFLNTMLMEAVTEIGHALRDNTHDHTVVVVSTVMPGTMTGEVIPTLHKLAGRPIAACYSPEFIALGSVIEDMQHPDVILIGASTPQAGQHLKKLYATYVRDDPPVHVMGVISAEIAKISLNMYITTKIAFANMISELCDKIPGGDALRVLGALANDTRIGGKYLKPGAPFGGPCFPRDTVAFSALLDEWGVDTGLPDAVSDLNEARFEYIAEQVDDLLEDGQTLGILGLAYKPGTNVVDEALGMYIAGYFQPDNIPLNVYDPLVKAHPDIMNATWRNSPHEVLLNSAVTIVCTPDPEFVALTDWISGRTTVLDVWRLYGDHQHTIKLGVTPWH